MGNPVINRTVTVPIGATGVRLDLPGKHVKIVSCTAASVLMGYDQSTPERVYPDDCYAGPARGFESLRFIDDLGAGSTVVVQVAEQPILGGAFHSLAPLAASLAAIDLDLERLKPAGVLTIVNRLVVPQIGAAPPNIEILPANPLRKWVLVTADLANANNVYLGADNTVTDVVGSFFDMMAGGSWREHYTGAVWACSDNGTEAVRAYESI